LASPLQPCSTPTHIPTYLGTRWGCGLLESGVPPVLAIALQAQRPLWSFRKPKILYLPPPRDCWSSHWAWVCPKPRILHPTLREHPHSLPTRSNPTLSWASKCQSVSKFNSWFSPWNLFFPLVIKSPNCSSQKLEITLKKKKKKHTSKQTKQNIGQESQRVTPSEEGETQGIAWVLGPGSPQAFPGSCKGHTCVPEDDSLAHSVLSCLENRQTQNFGFFSWFSIYWY
jgi:hypothetical protein